MQRGKDRKATAWLPSSSLALPSGPEARLYLEGGMGIILWRERDYDNKSFFALSFILHSFLISFFLCF